MKSVLYVRDIGFFFNQDFFRVWGFVFFLILLLDRIIILSVMYYSQPSGLCPISRFFLGGWIRGVVSVFLTISLIYGCLICNFCV